MSVPISETAGLSRVRLVLKAVQQLLRKHPRVHRVVRSVWRPPQKIYRHLYFDGQFTIEPGPGASFRVECRGEEFENDLFWRGYGNGMEGQSLTLWRELVRDADYIADVGANTGIYALAAQALRPTARVLAIEPSPRVFAKLERNIDLNGFPTVAVECAASDRSGTALFFEYPGAHQYSASLEASMGGTIETEVATAPLDEIFARYSFDRIDVVKMDIERHEPQALRGMRQMLERHRPPMLIEILDEAIEREVREALNGLAYSFSRIGGPLDGDSRNFLVSPVAHRERR